MGLARTWLRGDRRGCGDQKNEIVDSLQSPDSALSNGTTFVSFC